MHDPTIDLDAWERATVHELARLGCQDRAQMDSPDNIHLETLWDELRRFDDDEYPYLQAHGYAAYWAWIAEREGCDADELSWLFRLENVGTPPYRCRLFKAEDCGPLLALLQALPDAIGGEAVWDALDGHGIDCS
jgi:hypothetical protein